jgi:dTDP-4-amino-4,6-dideoxygalactose transaminase
MNRIPFNKPAIVGCEYEHIVEVLNSGRLAGDGSFTERCHTWLRQRIGAQDVLLTQSCTAALEMAAILAELEPGDEVIMPSFNFVSPANAVALRRATPVFVDVRPDTLNIDEEDIEQAITPRTKAICVLHYGGVCAEMDRITALATKHGLIVIEDAAHAILSIYRGTLAGALGDLACFSFHETKNASCGEGGALLLNDAELIKRAYVIWEKGTNRHDMKLGLVDKYTWLDIGSSFLPSEVTAAILLAQLEGLHALNERRLRMWNEYHAGFETLERAGVARRPVVPAHCVHNGHLYYLLMQDVQSRDRLIRELAEQGIVAPFHYIPLHSSPAGRRYGRDTSDLAVTMDVSSRLIRLPLYADITRAEVNRVIDSVTAALAS